MARRTFVEYMESLCAGCSLNPSEFMVRVLQGLYAILQALGGGPGGGGPSTTESCRVVTADGAWGTTGDIITVVRFFSGDPPALTETLYFNETLGGTLVVGIDETNSDPCSDDSSLGADCEQPLFTIECGQDPNIGALTSSTVTSGPVVIASGTWSLSVMNLGSGNGTVDGQPLLPGESFNITGYNYKSGEAAGWSTVLLPEIEIDGTGTTLRVRSYS